LSRRQLIQLVVLGILLSTTGIAIALWINWFPTQASSQAKQIDTLFDVLLIASVPIFVLVEMVVLYSVWKFRMKPGEELKDGPPIHGNTRLEVVWTTIPTILLVGLCSYAYVVLRDIERKPAGHEMVVNVTGQQFAWSFEYPGENGGKSFKSDQLYLPEGQSVKFKVRSVDVIHDFWVPQFRLKIDAVPGITTSYRLKPSRTGHYTVVCAELCGLGHSTMRQSAHVLPKQQFDAWVTKHQSAAPTPSPS
jgi:cytochrome c oxidase subunit 2